MSSLFYQKMSNSRSRGSVPKGVIKTATDGGYRRAKTLVFAIKKMTGRHFLYYGSRREAI